MTAPERYYVVTVATDYVVQACSPDAAADDYAAGDPVGSEVVAVDGYGWNLDTALTVEVTAARRAGHGEPFPNLIGTVMHGPTAGDVVTLAAEAAEVEVILADLAELGAMPPVVLAEPDRVMAVNSGGRVVKS